MITHTDLTGSGWAVLATKAWATREHAVAVRTKVGAAALVTSEDQLQQIYGGCNIEDLWKASSIHAERTAIANAIAHGAKKIQAILVAAEREKFTPCGNCMDFIFQFGGPTCQIGFQGKPGGPVNVYTAHELMPEYPC
jgi:cytidine deaminase